ncbi:hypothetical protein N0V90_007198 [Kalmusia sp. IMI 367209]|nr:hypothetical protein N0V90_007198 [Kalmusia sp. IMI 367209]
MLAFSAQMMRPKGDEKEIEAFRKKVAADKHELKALLQRRLEQAENNDACRQNEMSTLIAEALTKSNRVTQREPATFPNTKIASNTIFESANKVDTACRSLLSEYKDFEEMIEKMAGDQDTAIIEKWTQEVKETERLIKLGHRTAVRNVKKVLGTELEGAQIAEEEDGGFGLPQKELNMELLDSLRYAERGVKRMVKSLPKDVD